MAPSAAPNQNFGTKHYADQAVITRPGDLGTFAMCLSLVIYDELFLSNMGNVDPVLTPRCCTEEVTEITNSQSSFNTGLLIRTQLRYSGLNS